MKRLRAGEFSVYKRGQGANEQGQGETAVQPEAKANFKAEMRATESHQNQSSGARGTLEIYEYMDIFCTPWLLKAGLGWFFSEHSGL